MPPKQYLPPYINNSMRWKNSEDISVLASAMNEQKSTLFVSAGNREHDIDKAQQKSAQEGKIIWIASLAPGGRPSKFTSYAESVTIAAPSDKIMRSHNFAGNAKNFDG